MIQSFLLLSNDTLVEAQLRDLLDEGNHLVSVATIGEVRSALSKDEYQGLLVHLDQRTVGDRLPRAFLAEIRELANSLPVYGLVGEKIPERLRPLAQEQLDACIDVPPRREQLHNVLRGLPDPVSDLAGLCSEMPYRALHAKTRSLLTFTPAMFDMLEELKVPAAHDVTVLLIGETGCGKTYLARLIHELSSRSEERFLTVACGALPPDLIESELFGYVKGAFTGADRDKEGKFAAAGQGTLLLDEIDVLTPEQQARLLRVIETGEYEPVGSNETQVSQARLIVASNYDLEGLVEQGTFRMDLYYRLNMLCFRLLPLRERPLDVEFLARRFALDHSRTHNIQLRHIEPEFLGSLRQYTWPGNIRELENVIRRAVLYCRRGVLSVADLPSSLREAIRGKPRVEGPTVAEAAEAARTLEAQVDLMEQKVIETTLRRHNNHRTATARELGISRVTLYNKMKKFGMLAR